MKPLGLAPTLVTALAILCSPSAPAWASHDHDDDLFKREKEKVIIGLAISGGGFRSAAFAYGAMRKLNEVYLCIIKIKEPDEGGNFKRIGTDKRPDNVLAITVDRSKCLNKVPRTLLENVDIISAVSGGALPALYYERYGEKEFLGKDGSATSFETRVLGSTDKLAKLLQEGGVSWWQTAVDLLPFIPGSMVVEKKLLDRKGLLSKETIAKLFDDEIFSMRSTVTEGKGKGPRVLIHATDVSRSKLFTLDATSDLQCVGIPELSPGQKVAITAAMPGLVEPQEYHLPKNVDTDTDYDSCATRFAAGQPVTLTDGGVYDNLAIEGLLRQFITDERKNYLAAGQSRKEYSPKKGFIIAVHSAPPKEYAAAGHNGETFPIVEMVLNAFDVLSNHRSAISRSLFEETARYGLTVVELHSVHVVPNDGYSSDVTPLASDVVRLRAELGSIGWFPNADERKQLINAGVLSTGHRLPTMGTRFHELMHREYVGACEDLIDMEREYCWPMSWVKQNPLNGPLDLMLSQLQADKRHIVEKQQEFLRQGLDGADMTLENAMKQAQGCDRVYAADYGLIDWSEGFNHYHEANLRAPGRGVQVNRVFVIPDTLLKRPKQLGRYVEVMFQQAGTDKVAKQVRPNGKKCSGELTIKVAVQSELLNETNEPNYEFQNGMALFEYGNGLTWLLEEVVNGQGTSVTDKKQPSFLGRYYALRSYVSLSKDKQDPKGVADESEIGKRYKFLRWLTDSPNSKTVCRLPRFEGDSKEKLLESLKDGQNPCGKPSQTP